MAAKPRDALGLGRSVFLLMRLGHLIRSTLLYGLAGPPIGSAWWMVYSGLEASEPRDWSLGYVAGLFGGVFISAPLVLPFSYLHGFFPALLTGFLLGLLPRQLPLVVLLPLAGIVGWMATNFVGPVDMPLFGGLAAMTLAAAAAGLSWLSGRLGRAEEAVD